MWGQAPGATGGQVDSAHCEMPRSGTEARRARWPGRPNRGGSWAPAWHLAAALPTRRFAAATSRPSASGEGSLSRSSVCKPFCGRVSDRVAAGCWLLRGARTGTRRGCGAKRAEVSLSASGHRDEHPSCRVHPTRGVWYCDVCAKGGGPFRAAVELAGLTPTRLGCCFVFMGWGDGRGEQLLAGELLPYRDEQGTLLFEVLRYRDKQFRQRRPHPTIAGEWCGTCAASGGSPTGFRG